MRLLAPLPLQDYIPPVLFSDTGHRICRECPQQTAQCHKSEKVGLKGLTAGDGPVMGSLPPALLRVLWPSLWRGQFNSH